MIAPYRGPTESSPRSWLATATVDHSQGVIAAWVAEEDVEVVGHVAIHARSSRELVDAAASALGCRVDELGVVARLFVAATHRRRGLGRQLLDNACRDAHARHLLRILDVAAHLHRAVSLYERSGWTRVATVAVQIQAEHLVEHVYAAPGSAFS